MLPHRIMIPHCSVDAPTIDAFHCSNCEWTLSLPQPKPYLVAHNDAEYACRKFDDHRCEDFNQVHRKMSLKTVAEGDAIIVTCSACDWMLTFRVSSPDLDQRLQLSAQELFHRHRCSAPGE